MKTVAVFAIIFGCFAILYPKIFHPMLFHLLGMAPSRRSADDISRNLKTACILSSVMLNNAKSADRVKVHITASTPNGPTAD